jgi:hypothetical protein
MVDSASSTPQDLAQTYAQSMLIAGSAGGGGFGLLGGGEPLILMPPEIANTFQRGGCTKAQAKALIHERAVLPLDRLSPAIRAHLVELRIAAEDGDATGPLRVARDADDVMIVVTGGVGVKAAYMPTWGGTTKAVSRLIRDIR